MEWYIDGDEIEIQVTAPTTGWVGFGLSESGGMIGGDQLVVIVDDVTGDVTWDDHNSIIEAQPIVDDCNDWTVLNACQGSSETIFRARRKLDTGDTQDWQILNNSHATRVIAAYGMSDTFSYHGVDYRMSTKIDFFNELESPTPALAALQSDTSVSRSILNKASRFQPLQRTITQYAQIFPAE